MVCVAVPEGVSWFVFQNKGQDPDLHARTPLDVVLNLPKCNNNFATAQQKAQGCALVLHLSFVEAARPQSAGIASKSAPTRSESWFRAAIIEQFQSRQAQHEQLHSTIYIHLSRLL